MRRPVGSRRVLVGLAAGLLLLSAGCAGRGTQTRGVPSPGEGFLIITDSDGTLLGAVPFKQTLGAAEIVVKTSDILAPEDLLKVTPERSFASEFRTITLFGMGNPCRYVIQGGKAVKVCT